MGKNLARKFEFETLEDIYYFFQQIGWGNLELVKERRRELIFHLLSDSVVHRLQAPFEADFRLEAGFLAEAIQQLEETECECIEDINHRIHQIRRSEEHTSELQSRFDLVCRLLLEKKKS